MLTNMVKELDELQGYMGMVYAKAFGEEEEVAKAIYEHYFPKAPQTLARWCGFSDSLLGGQVG